MRVMSAARVTTGLRWPPEILSVAMTRLARAKPCANATIVTNDLWSEPSLAAGNVGNISAGLCPGVTVARSARGLEQMLLLPRKTNRAVPMNSAAPCAM